MLPVYSIELRVYAERCPSIDIIAFLHTDQIEKSKRRRDKKPKASKSPLGPWR